MNLTIQNLTILACTVIAGLGAAYTTGIELAAGFLPGLILLYMLARRAGMTPKQLNKAMLAGAGHTREVVWILLMVGLLIPSWSASGTIPYMIERGLSLLDPHFFVTESFVFSAIVAMLLGTSTGTLSSLGIALMGVAAVLQVPLPLAAGALVSGAFVGDRTSPLSSACRLTAASSGLTAAQHWRAMLPTTVGALTVSVGFFLLADLRGDWASPAAGSAAFGAGGLGGAGYIAHPVLLLPPVLLIAAIAAKVRTRDAFLLAVAAAAVIAVALQGESPIHLLQSLWSGYDWPHGASGLDLHGKGVASMIGLVTLILLAGAFNGILEESRALEPYVKRLLGRTSSLGSATARVACLGAGLGLTTCTQTLPIMMTARMLLPFWRGRFTEHTLARITADTSLIFAAMVPWNMLALLCGTILGVSVDRYLADAPFLWSLPILTLLVSAVSDIRRKRAPSVGRSDDLHHPLS